MILNYIKCEYNSGTKTLLPVIKYVIVVVYA